MYQRPILHAVVVVRPREKTHLEDRGIQGWALVEERVSVRGLKDLATDSGEPVRVAVRGVHVHRGPREAERAVNEDFEHGLARNLWGGR